MKTKMLGHKIFSGLLLVSLMVFGFVVPTALAQAQFGSVQVCASDTGTAAYFLGSAANCQAGYTVLPSPSFGSLQRVCIYVSSTTRKPFKLLEPRITGVSGVYICDGDNAANPTVPSSVAVSNSAPGGGSPGSGGGPGGPGNPPTGGGTGTGGSGGSGAVTCPAGTTASAGSVVCLPDNPFGTGNPNAITSITTVSGLISFIIKTLLYFAGILAVIYIILGGYYYLTSRGDTKQADKGRATLTNAVIGLILVVVAFALVTIVTNFVTAGP
jgi:hypothetical protein